MVFTVPERCLTRCYSRINISLIGLNAAAKYTPQDRSPDLFGNTVFRCWVPSRELGVGGAASRDETLFGYRIMPLASSSSRPETPSPGICSSGPSAKAEHHK